MSELLPALSWDTGKYEVNKKLGQFVQYFQVNLPVTGTGIPMQIVKPERLIESLVDCDTTDDVPDEALQNSLVTVEYTDGIPSVDGLPVWERMEGEPLHYYDVFKEYRDMVKLSGTRALSKLAIKYDVPGKVLSALSKVYHWQLRCRLFDSYEAMIRERKRQFDIEQLESRHSKAAAILLEQGLAFVENHPEQLNPKVAIQMIEVGMKAGRLALGLAGDKVASVGAPAANININQTMSSASDGGTIEITQKTQTDKADTEYLQSIVHILDMSGALDQAKADAIEASYEEVDSVDAAVEGT